MLNILLPLFFLFISICGELTVRHEYWRGNLSCQGDGCVPYWNCESKFRLVGACKKANHVCCGKNLGPEVYEPSCGVRNLDPIDGYAPDLETSKSQHSHFGEWPHVCIVVESQEIKVVKTHGSVSTFISGASLVDRQVIITAAHNIIEVVNSSSEFVDSKYKVKPNLRIRCGDWNITSDEEPRLVQVRNISKVEIHPEFNHENAHNDIAVIFVEKPFDLDSTVYPVCLPQPNYDLSSISGQCYAQGYGRNSLESGSKFNSLQKEVQLKVVEFQECQKILRTTRLGNLFELDSSFLCAGGRIGNDTCKGDGGSPLVCQIGGQNAWTQIGMVSWGIGCNDNIPGVYANVGHLMCWIDFVASRYFESEGSFFGLAEGECSIDEIVKYV